MNNISNKIYSKNMIEYATRKVNLLGISNTYDPIFLLNLRFFVCICIFVFLLYFINFGYFIAPFVTFLIYNLFFPIFIDTKIKKRGLKLESEATYFFEILALSLEAGRNIKMAIEVTTSNIDSELSKEFAKALNDMSYGKSLTEVLNDLKYRIPSDTINNIILNIRESNIFGNNIIETVYSQVDYLREKKILETKAKISKIPVKISVISVIYFLPLLILLLLGPLIIDWISEIL